ncbi:MAG: hypothetical protein GIX02_04950 [Candidatus Eremiobacteraeota bacterium]|nr:hypothetical protein [Candidatus Eremiobacteraeota bacterium]
MPVRTPFTVLATATSHGWYQTMPFRLDPELESLERAEALRDGRVMLLGIRDERSSRRGYRDVIVTVRGEGASHRGVAREMMRRCIAMLHLDEDLSGFYSICRSRPELRVALKAGAGRCMRGSSLWEDAVKAILGTNVLWRQAVVMINRLAELGDVCPARPALRAWPSPGQVTRAGERYLRDYVRAGYRAPYIVELAHRQKAGDIDLESLDARAAGMDSAELFKALVAIKGVGKSSAHFLMNLLRHYDHIAVDSATYAYAKRALFKGKRPTERQIRRRFAQFGNWQSLVYWFARWSPGLAWWEDAQGRASS